MKYMPLRTGFILCYLVMLFQTIFAARKIRLFTLITLSYLLLRYWIIYIVTDFRPTGVCITLVDKIPINLGPTYLSLLRKLWIIRISPLPNILWIMVLKGECSTINHLFGRQYHHRILLLKAQVDQCYLCWRLWCIHRHKPLALRMDCEGLLPLLLCSQLEVCGYFLDGDMQDSKEYTW